MNRLGALAALGAAVLFGAGMPLAKWLLQGVGPWILAALLYLGSGIGLTIYRMLIHAPSSKLRPSEMLWLLGAIAAGGVVAPVLLMLGLTNMPASGASLLLNAEGVFTAMLAWIASVKGLVAGSVNLGLALAMGATFPKWTDAAGAMVVGFFAYGVSLTLFVVGLRHLGTARTGAYFSAAPFIGAGVAVAMGEAVTVPLLIAGSLMATGLWLHLSERHEHVHTHEILEHSHEHVHDEHHRHEHP